MIPRNLPFAGLRRGESFSHASGCVLDDATALAHSLTHSQGIKPGEGCLVGFSAVLDDHGRSWTMEREATVTARHSSMGFCVDNAACVNRAAYDGACVESAVCCVVWLRKARGKVTL